MLNRSTSNNKRQPYDQQAQQNITPQEMQSTLDLLTNMIHPMADPVLIVSSDAQENLHIEAINPAFEKLLKHAQAFVGASFDDFFKLNALSNRSNLFSLAQKKSILLNMAYKSATGDFISTEAHFTPFCDAHQRQDLGLLLLKNPDTKINGETEDSVIRVLHDLLASCPFKEAVMGLLRHLVPHKHCVQASLWWRSVYATAQAPLVQVASVGTSDLLSIETQELLYRQLMQAVSPEPGFVLHHLEKGHVYALPLYVEEEVRGAVFLVSNPVLVQGQFSFCSRFLGQTLGAKLERKFLSQTLKEWVSYSSEPVMISDSQGVIYQSNAAFRKLLGYVNEADDFFARVWDCLHPGELSRFRADYAGLQPGAKVLFEGRCVKRGGEALFVSWTMTCSSENDLIYHVIRDTSHHYALTQRLQQAYALAKMGTWEVDVEKDVVYWSPMTRAIYEIEDLHDESMLRNGLSYFCPEDRPVIELAVQNCSETGESWDLQLRIVTAKGNEKWVRTLGEGELEDGKCKRMFGIFVDIDARKRAELAQAKQTQMLALLNRVHQQFLSVGWQKVLPKALQSYVDVLDIDLIMYFHGTEISTSSVNIFLPETMAPLPASAQEDLLAVMKSLRPEVQAVFSVPTLVDNHLSSYFKLLSLATVSMWPLFSNGSLQGVFVLGSSKTSLTEAGDEESQRFLETFAYSLSQAMANQQSLEDLQGLNAELAENMNALAYSNQELEQFAYIASHDLQEPLRMVTSFLHQLEKKYAHVLDEKARRYIYFAADGAKRMRQIISDLLDYSRLGKPSPMVYEPIITHDLITEIITLLRQKTEETQAQITYTFPPNFSAPRMPLRQVLQNLVENALKYRNPHMPPRIHICLQEIAGTWQFSVQDNGIGIHSDYFEKIFIIFQRLHSRDKYEGTGVGLALCKKIMDQCQGEIWVESTLGQGSTFYFQIPKGECL